MPLFKSKVSVWDDIIGTIVHYPYFFEKAISYGFVTCSVTPFVNNRAAKLWNIRIVSAKCAKWHRLDTPQYVTKFVWSWNTIFWSHHITQFSISLAFAISWSDTYGFLGLGIYEVQSLHVHETNFIGFKRFHEMWDSKRTLLKLIHFLKQELIVLNSTPTKNTIIWVK